MAFQSGSQINAGLGRTDFTPYLQGASQGAQMQARGAEQVAAGIASLGQQVATGVEKYYKKQEENKLNEQAVDTVGRIFTTNPAFAQQVGLKPDASGSFDPKAIGAVVKSLGGAANTISFANTLSEFTRKQTEESETARQFMAYEASGGKPASPLSGPVSPMANMRALDAFNKQQLIQSETAKNLFAASKIRPSSDSYNNVAEANFAIQQMQATNKLPAGTTPVIKQEGGRYYVETVATQPSSVLTPEQALALKSGEQAIAAAGDFIKGVKQNAEDANNQFETATQITNAINSGATTGLLAKTSGLFKSVGEVLFNNDFGAADQQLLAQGVKGFGLAGIRKLFRGLGAMSDADRKAGEDTVMSISDAKKSIQYYTEVARLNQERSRDDVNFISRLQRDKVNSDEIQRQLEERRQTRPLMTDEAYRIVFKDLSSSAKRFLPTTPAK